MAESIQGIILAFDVQQVYICKDDLKGGQDFLVGLWEG